MRMLFLVLFMISCGCITAFEPFRWRNTQLYLKLPSVPTDLELLERDIWPKQEEYDPQLLPKSYKGHKKKSTEVNRGYERDDNDDDDKEEGEETHYEFLPVLPEACPTTPGSRHFLFINEMKFRGIQYHP